MPVEITGIVSHNTGTPLAFAPQDEFDVDAIVASAIAQEKAGYDRVLIAANSMSPDSHTIGAFVAAKTTRLKVMLAHRPGFVAPTMAARTLATVDRLSGGRVGVHIIAGPSDKELEADGDFLTKEARYARAREYVSIMRSVWSSSEPIDHAGEYYRFNQAFAPIKPHNGSSIPVFWAGTSDVSIEACGATADIFAMSGDSLGNIAEHLGRAKVAAAAHGRSLDYMMTIIVILGDTEEAAWAKADGVLDAFVAMRDRLNPAAEKGQSNFAAPSHASERVLGTAAAGLRHDRCLWMGVTEAAQGKFGNQTTLVGTAEQVTEALMDYYRLGVTRFLIRGFYPTEDTVQYGENLFPLLRAAALKHDDLAKVKEPS
jgi:alkanesulfonate monooxygenase